MRSPGRRSAWLTVRAGPRGSGRTVELPDLDPLLEHRLPPRYLCPGSSRASIPTTPVCHTTGTEPPRLLESGRDGAPPPHGAASRPSPRPTRPQIGWARPFDRLRARDRPRFWPRRGRLYTDWLWFSALGYCRSFSKILTIQVELFAIGALAFGPDFSPQRAPRPAPGVGPRARRRARR